MMKKTIAVCLLLISFCAAAQDRLTGVIKSELNRNFTILKQQPIPAYYAYVRVDDIQTMETVADLGALQSEATMDSPRRILTASLRVGDYTLDNSHEIRESGYGDNGANVAGSSIPIEDNDRILKNTIWQSLDELYKDAIQTYEQVKANLTVKVEQEDKSPDFSQEPVADYYEKPIEWSALHINPQVLEEKVRRYSAVFDANDHILQGVAYFTITLSRTLFVDTEGREMASNDVNIQLVLTATTMADDGMGLPLYHSWMGHSIEELPSDEEVIRKAQEISATLTALRQAPVVESFTGPAILSPAAASVFFHEIFGHRVEGSRLKQENDAQTFKKKIGEYVLPKDISVTFDPTISHYKGQPLMGNYHFDDEGIPAQKVEVAKNGKLVNFLMSRTPIEGFLHSNGHGRGGIGATPVSRQSNMLVESSQGFSQDELLKRLRKEAKSQGKKYAYYFKEVSGGYTNTHRYSPNSFNVTPLLVYRVYVDGRPDELVRGVNIVGTPLTMFSQIAACGNESGIFNGVCGAESGNVPVSCVAPALLVKRIETQKKPKNQSQPILLSKPQSTAEKADLSQDSILFRAIQTEVQRGLDSLTITGLQRPFFIAYNIRDIKQLNVSATHGSLMSQEADHVRRSGVRLLIGDYQCTDENFQSTVDGQASLGGSPTLDNDEKALRSTIWKDLDAVYKSAAETYEQKVATIKQLNIPAKDLELPDWDKTPVVQLKNPPFRHLNFDAAPYETYLKEASAVFNDYPEILDSWLNLQLAETQVYFYNTEGTKFVYPITVVYVRGVVTAKTSDNKDINSAFAYTFRHTDELPDLADLKAECRALAKDLLEKINAPKIEESYSGPVLFEDLAVPSIFYESFFSDLSLIAVRKPLTTSGFSYGGNGIEEMMGKRITAREITIEDLTGTPEYQGQALLGYAPIDAQGVVPPAKLTLVDKGILVDLLSDRVPTPKTPHSNGHALFDITAAENLHTGVIRLSDTRTQDAAQLKRQLLDRAKEEGYDYAYIVRDLSSDAPDKLYKVSVADGSEQRIRGAELNNISSQIFKQIIGVSDKELIYNTIAGNLLTVITPNAILFEDMQIQSDRIDNFQKAPIVPQPE